MLGYDVVWFELEQGVEHTVDLLGISYAMILIRSCKDYLSFYDYGQDCLS